MLQTDTNTTVTQIPPLEPRYAEELNLQHGLQQHWVPRLSAKSRKMGLQFTQAHQNPTTRDRNDLWSDESGRSNVQVRILHKENESMEPCIKGSCWVV